MNEEAEDVQSKRLKNLEKAWETLLKSSLRRNPSKNTQKILILLELRCLIILITKSTKHVLLYHVVYDIFL